LHVIEDLNRVYADGEIKRTMKDEFLKDTAQSMYTKRLSTICSGCFGETIAVRVIFEPISKPHTSI
jgi:hypothetical protein